MLQSEIYLFLFFFKHRLEKVGKQNICAGFHQQLKLKEHFNQRNTYSLARRLKITIANKSQSHQNTDALMSSVFFSY